MNTAVRPEADLLALTQRAVHERVENNHATVRIEPGVEDQRAQRRVRIALRRRNACTTASRISSNADPVFGAGQNGIARIESDDLLNLFANPLGLGRGQIDLIDDRNDFEIVIQGEIRIRKSLRFDTLRSVHHQQRSFAGLQAARDFVGEIHVTRRIDEVELVCWPSSAL